MELTDGEMPNTQKFISALPVTWHGRAGGGEGGGNHHADSVAKTILGFFKEGRMIGAAGLDCWNRR